MIVIDTIILRPVTSKILKDLAAYSILSRQMTQLLLKLVSNSFALYCQYIIIMIDTIILRPVTSVIPKDLSVYFTLSLLHDTTEIGIKLICLVLSIHHDRD